MSVLLVDSDVAKQHITGIFGLSKQRGLLDALQDDTIDPESLVVPTNYTRALNFAGGLSRGGYTPNCSAAIGCDPLRKI